MHDHSSVFRQTVLRLIKEGEVFAAAEWLSGGAPAAEPSAAAAALLAAGPSGAPWSLWDSGEWWMLLAAQSMAIGTVSVMHRPPFVCKPPSAISSVQVMHQRCWSR